MVFQDNVMNVQKSVDNSLFRMRSVVGASRFKLALWFVISSLFFKNSLFIFSAIKIRLLKLFGAKIGERVLIKPSVNIKYPWKLHIDDNSWIGEDVWIDNQFLILIGKNVCISQGAFLLTGSHDPSKSTFDFMGDSIIIEDGVWIGAKSTVTGGVRCRSHSILGINSVCENDLEAYTIYKGNPAVPVVSRNISQ
jgi:putative colanic acid biosynthesis acetyltransferase WcaF